jgi:histidyl-tRNA synthetase
MLNHRQSDDTPLWQWVEERIRRVVYRYGYQEIRLPVLESAELYAATGSGVMLRPEGTLGCVKAVVDQRGSHRQDTRRLWYQGPMFAPGVAGPEQFHQFGVEAFGLPGAEIDAELIMLSRDLFAALGLNRKVSLEINTLGSWQEQNDPGSNHLSQDSRLHFATLCHLLDSGGIAYTVNPLMRNGQGYYSRTVFDWVLDQPDQPRLALASGGRYDELAGRCCGRALAASGFAFDFECVLQRVEQDEHLLPGAEPQIILRVEGPEQGLEAVLLSQRLRRQLPALMVRADLAGAVLAPIPAHAQWVVTLTALRQAEVWSCSDGVRRQVSLDQVADLIAGSLLRPTGVR